jgi:hypothetical protein
MKTLTTLLSLLILISISSCDEDFICEKANGSFETRTLNLSDIDGLSMGISGNVIISIGNEQSVTIEAQRDILDNLNTFVTGGTWNISLDQCFRNYSDVNIYVTVPSLSYVGLSGSGSILSNSTITSNSFKTSLSGSGTIDLTVEANNMDTNISGSGSVNLSGSTNQHDISIAGSGNANTYGLTSSFTNARISGSGNAMVQVVDELDVSISGSGNVIYEGSPTINSSISGSGQVKQRN